MQTRQQLAEEKYALDKKRVVLGTFIGSGAYRSLPEAEQSRLTQQGIAMTKYSDILGERIAAF